MNYQLLRDLINIYKGIINLILLLFVLQKLFYNDFDLKKIT